MKRCLTLVALPVAFITAPAFGQSGEGMTTKIYANADYFTDPYADTFTLEGGAEWDGRVNIKAGGFYQNVDNGREDVVGGVVSVATTLDNGLKLRARAQGTNQGLHGLIGVRKNGPISIEAQCDHDYIATALAIRKGIDATGCSLSVETKDNKPVWAAVTADIHGFSDDNRRTMIALATRFKLDENFTIAHRSRRLDFKKRVPEYFSPDTWDRHQVTLQYNGKYDRGTYRLEAGPGIDRIDHKTTSFGIVGAAVYYDYGKTSMFGRAVHQFGSAYHFTQVTVGISIPL